MHGGIVTSAPVVQYLSERWARGRAGRREEWLEPGKRGTGRKRAPTVPID